jgi:hypothetical protein
LSRPLRPRILVAALAVVAAIVLRRGGPRATQIDHNVRREKKERE